MPLKFVCISDTHLSKDFEIPDGDVLIHAGDFTGRGNVPELSSAIHWFSKLPHKLKICIAGNHDCLLQDEPYLATRMMQDAGIIYLEDSGITICPDGSIPIGGGFHPDQGVTIYGSPWTPTFFDWAFMKKDGDLKEKWDTVPAGVDILITHGPPRGCLDMTDRGEAAGCESLGLALYRIKPRYHIFGHIHRSPGIERRGDTWCVNCSILGENYDPVNKPVVFKFGQRPKFAKTRGYLYEDGHPKAWEER
jgi:predicted phosphodiesterase